MAARFFSGVFPKTLTLTPFFSRSRSISTLRRLHPLSAASLLLLLLPNPSPSFSTHSKFYSSVNDTFKPISSTNFPKDMPLPAGMDFKHFFVLVQKPDDVHHKPATKLQDNDVVDSFVKTLAKVIGSEEEAKMKIYSVETTNYFAFGVHGDEELADKLRELPEVLLVFPDCYWNVEEKQYKGTPFINGQLVHREYALPNAGAYDSLARAQIDGKELLCLARSRLSEEKYHAFLAIGRENHLNNLTKEEALRKVDEILGPENKDVYYIVVEMINRNVNI